MTFELNLTSESVEYLNKCFEASQDDVSCFGSEVGNKISSAVDKYVSLTNPEMTGERLTEYKTEIREAIIEYLVRINFQDSEIDSLENITRIAFLRLAKASKDCYFEKMHSLNSAQFDNLKKISERLKRDYELIMNIN